MSISQVKEKLKNDPDLIVNILEKLGCHEINHYNTKEIRCALPDGETNTSVQVMLDDNITCNVYSRSTYSGGSIIDFAGFIKKIVFSKSLQWLCKELGIDYVYNPTQECETYKYFKKFKDKKDNIIEHEMLDENLLKQYKNQIIKSWLDEGIGVNTQTKYEVKYDAKSNRIIFPVRDDFGNLINIKGRTCYENYKDLGMRKYTHFYPLGNNDVLFGLHLNRDYILNQNEVILFEAEKSVMKCDSYGVYNTLSVGTHTINDYQIPKILKLKCNVVVAFDKDVSHNELLIETQKLNKFTNVYIIKDKNNLLDISKKDSPIDKGLNIWNQLYKEKVKII